MTLREYIKILNDFAEENPEKLDMQVITSSDDEGNGYNLIHYSPSKGYYDLGEFYGENDDDEYSPDEINAVCVN